MSNNLPTLLAELSEIAPQICQRKDTEFAGTWYKIGDYEFGHDLWVDGEFLADCATSMVRGLPAYDWLQGALMRVIKSKDWGYKIQSPASTELTFAKVYFLPDGIFSSDGDNATETLLIALIQAIKGG